MQSENRNCQNCRQQFVIEPEDFQFYGKIKVPPPTWCPECRFLRRLMFRNERTWYRRKCDATGASILSMMSSDKPYKVYAQDYWRSDSWDPLAYGREYDFSKSFFAQFEELFRAIPHPNLIQKNVVHSDYANHVLNLKNCYYVAGMDGGEDCMYVLGSSLHLKMCVDVHQTDDSEFCYELVDSRKSNRLRFSQACEGCVDSFFLYDCRNCINCFGCVGLRGKQYYIFNKPYSREDYMKELERLDLGSYENLKKAKSRFEELKLHIPRKYAAILRSENVVGDEIVNTRHCFFCFNTRNDVENGKYLFRVWRAKDGYDGFIVWNGAEVFYETVSISGQNILFSAFIWGGFDVQYSYLCFDCNNIFGCIGLRNKSYCILNKQYTKEEYEALVPKIIAHMKETPYKGVKGRKYGYGEFFPPEIFPFAYNESMAQDYFPRTMERVEAQGFSWKTPEEKKYGVTKHPADLPDHIKDVNDRIAEEVVGCTHEGKCNEQCATAFRITVAELQFYRKTGVPLPRLCPSCRHYQRLKLKNPVFVLWHRQCTCAGTKSENGTYQNTVSHFHGTDHCPNEFETSYAPDRKEIVYCEQCYNAEVV